MIDLGLGGPSGSRRHEVIGKTLLDGAKLGCHWCCCELLQKPDDQSFLRLCGPAGFGKFLAIRRMVCRDGVGRTHDLRLEVLVIKPFRMVDFSEVPIKQALAGTCAPLGFPSNF